MIRALKAWGPAALWAVVLFLSSELHVAPREWDIELADKLAHFVLYGVLGAALAWGRWTSGPEAVPHWLLLGAGWAYGVLDEWHQSFVPGRTPEGADLLVDVLGVAAGYALFFPLARRLTSSVAGVPPDSAAPDADQSRRGR